MSENTETAVSPKRKYRRLTDQEIVEIREKWATKKYTQSQLAEEYGTNQPNISFIVRSKTHNKEQQEA